MANGSHTLVPTALWHGGSQTLQGDAVTVDVLNTVAPVPTGVAVSFASPAVDSWVRGTASVIVSATVSGSKAAITSISLSVDGGRSATMTGARSSFSVDTSGLADGQHVLFAEATASDGTQGSATRTFDSDNTPPTVALMSPSSGATLNGKIVLTAAAQDARSAVAAVSYYAGSTFLGIAQGGPGRGSPDYAFSWDTTGTSDGTYLLVARATDATGNVGTSTPVQVTISNHRAAPTVAVTSPAGGSTLSGGVNVVAAVTDGSALTNLALYLDGNPTGTPEAATQWFWDTTQVLNGPHAIQVQGTDAAGNSFSSAPVQVTIANAWLGTVAQYYGDPSLQKLKVERNDANVNFNWGIGSPDPTLPSDHFSARWRAELLAPDTGTYQLYSESDDGVRVWVNDVLVIDNWTDHGATENAAEVALTEGTPASIRVEYYENGGAALMQLLWAGPGIPKQTIPRSAFRQPSHFPIVTAVAFGTPVANVYPKMQISVGGVPLLTYSVGSKPRNYAVKVAPDTLQLAKVHVAFLNDAYAPPEDRNLNVKTLYVGATAYSTLDASTYMQGCQTGYLETPWLDCDGYFEFATLSTK